MPTTRSTTTIALLGALSLASLACASDGGSSSASAGQSSAPPSPTVASSSPAAPSVTFAFDGTDPVATRALTGIDATYMNPGAVIEDGEILHMYPNVFSSWPGRMVVPHLTSTDGRSWTLAGSKPALTSDDIPFADAGMDVSTGFVRDDGTWVLVFETVDVTDPWVLGLATAPGPDGPWTVRKEPILQAGARGSFDAAGVSWPSVIARQDGYAMYYTGVDRPRGTTVIGLATSSDGITWTKRPTPVFEAEMRWEGHNVDRPRIASTARGLAMVYAGARLTDRGLAWSDDGVTWQRDGGRPVITQQGFPVLGQAWDAALIARGEELQYFLEIGIGNGDTPSTDVYLATAAVR